MENSPALEEARRAMIAKRFGGNASGANTGGAVRRKKKSAHKTGGGNDLFLLQLIQL
jgi:hypothetical protein